MNTTPIDALAAALAVVDPEGLDRSEMAALVAATTRARGALDALDARIALAMSRSGQAPVVLLLDQGRRSGKDAHAVVGRATVCGLLPGLHDALASGQVSAGHADAVAGVAARLDDPAVLVELAVPIVAAAVASSVEVFDKDMRHLERLLSGDEGMSRHQRLRRQRGLRRWVDRTSGMCHTHVLLDPEADATLSAALDAAVAAEQARDERDERTWDQLRADAFVGLVCGARGQRRRPEIAVLIDLATLRDGLHDHSVCETSDGQPLPPAVVRRLACDADVVPVVLGGDGVPLDVGRSRRVATHAQRLALRAMYDTCAEPGCTVRFADCDIHHRHPWHQGGSTDLANLIPLCSRHHHDVHAHGDGRVAPRARAPAA